MHIFLSYASEQRDIAEAIAYSLRGEGHSVFLDKHALPPGETYDPQIDEAIRRCDFFIFLVSPQSIEARRYTLTELEFARKKWPHPRGHVLPVMVQPIPKATIPSYLKAVSALEPVGDIAAEVAERIRSLQKPLGRIRISITITLAAFFYFVASAGVYKIVDPKFDYWLIDPNDSFYLARSFSYDLLPNLMIDNRIYLHKLGHRLESCRDASSNAIEIRAQRGAIKLDKNGEPIGWVRTTCLKSKLLQRAFLDSCLAYSFREWRPVQSDDPKLEHVLSDETRIGLRMIGTHQFKSDVDDIECQLQEQTNEGWVKVLSRREVAALKANEDKLVFAVILLILLLITGMATYATLKFR